MTARSMELGLSSSALDAVYNLAKSHHQDLLTHSSVTSVSPTSDSVTIRQVYDALPKEMPQKGLGTEQTIIWLLENIVQGFARGQSGSRYFGFVTGGVVPAAQLGDFITTIYDQNVQVHLPEQSISTLIEARTLEMVLELLSLNKDAFKGRIITTGATASNILGLACGRDWAIKRIKPEYDASEDGLSGAPIVKVLADRPHLSILKAAAVIGIGRSNVESIIPRGKELGVLEKTMRRYREEGVGMIVLLSFGEVNTGEFTSDIPKIRELCDSYGAWLHIDAAFGAFARISSSSQIRALANGLELGDSITADGHKWLNVPYDAGLFFTRNESDLVSVFGHSPRTGGAAYLKAHSNTDEEDMQPVTSPLYLGIENSRRFRALPMFCALVSLGREGYSEIVDRNIAFAGRVADWINGPGKDEFELLNGNEEGTIPLNIVLFRAKRDLDLQSAINRGGRIYVTGTQWEGRSAIRLAVSNWATGLEGNGDLEAVISALKNAVNM